MNENPPQLDLNQQLDPAFWGLVDAVLLINLDHRVDRWNQFQQAAVGIIPTEKIHRISAVLGKELPGYGVRPWFRGRKRDLTWAARAGCTLSHRRALLVARDQGWQTVLILEDDVTLDPSLPSILVAVAEALQRDEASWQLCYLGFTDPVAPCRVLDQISESHRLVEISGCSTTHAYLVRPRARDWILAKLPDERSIWRWLTRHRAIDRWYKLTLARHFPITCVSPSIINQQAGFSDIAQRETDYLQTGAHLLRVPDAMAITPGYGLRRLLRNIRTFATGTTDWFRSFAKCFRGF